MKAFKFLHVHLVLQHSLRRCRCTKKHLKVEGALTKASATYVPDLAEALARDFKNAIIAKHKREEDEEIQIEGLENQAINHIANTLDWEVADDWAFKKESHINLLEMRSVERLVEFLVKKDLCDMRVVSLVDSNVTRCAVAKGRSSSTALSSVLRRISSMLVASGIYLCTPYVPSRLNISDDPTRLVPLRTPAYAFGEWDRDSFLDLALLILTRRWASNWIRLVLRVSSFSTLPPYLDLPHRRLKPRSMDFDQTLGFPSEGPWILRLGSCIFRGFYLLLFTLALLFVALISPIPLMVSCSLSPSFRLPLGRPVGLLVFFSSCRGVSAMVNGPRNQADFSRINFRNEQGPLPEGRMVLEVTAAQRNKLLDGFYQWCSSEGLEINVWLADFYSFLEEINLCLCRYGRLTYSWGRPMNHFVETINALTSLKPALRRNLQAPWDLAFNWSRMEPNVHHIAAPFQ